PSALAVLRAAACVAWAQPRIGDAAPEWINPWNQRSAVRVASAVRAARLLLQVHDEYGEIDAELHVTRDAIVVEIGGETVSFARPFDAGAFLVRRHDNVVQTAHSGLSLAATVQPKIELSLSHGQIERSGNAILAPLHGVVSQLYVAVGHMVE